MLDKQKIVTAMNDIFDISGETHTDVLVFTRRQFLILFDDIIHSKKYDANIEEIKNAQ